ncbi:MAG: DNA polymerase beta superfamily protein [bacterium]
MSRVRELDSKKLITPPNHVVEGVQYEVMMGSVAYGVSNDTSDIDIYGFSIPPKEIIFPHLKGEILGFGRQTKRFEQYQQHHIYDSGPQKEYDITIYNIVKYFQLVMENNPNMIDSLFVPQRCVLYCTRIGEHVRSNRKVFLHKGGFHKFKGYAFSQLNKTKKKNPEGKRKEIVDKYGYDLKFATHLVRLLNEIEQILIEGDLDLERNREQLKSIRRGEWKLQEIEDYFTQKERSLEDLYSRSSLPYGPDEKTIKNILMECLEEYYGSLDNCIKKDSDSNMILNELKEIVRKYDRG